MPIPKRCMLPIFATLVMSAYSVGQSQNASSGYPVASHDSVIKGLVTSASGKRLKKAHVTLVNVLTEEKSEALTDKSGAFRFASLYSGRYKLEVTTQEGETAADDVPLGRNETV